MKQHEGYVGPHIPRDTDLEKVRTAREEGLRDLRGHEVHNALIDEYFSQIDFDVASHILNQEFCRGIPPSERQGKTA